MLRLLNETISSIRPSLEAASHKSHMQHWAAKYCNHQAHTAVSVHQILSNYISIFMHWLLLWPGAWPPCIIDAEDLAWILRGTRWKSLLNTSQIILASINYKAMDCTSWYILINDACLYFAGGHYDKMWLKYCLWLTAAHCHCSLMLYRIDSSSELISVAVHTSSGQCQCTNPSS